MILLLRGLSLAILLCCSLAAQSSVDPGSQEPKRRPKVGVALAGGSALGLAHIGVLRWFDENRIPVDYIVGTSMGGLVGGLFASGKSPAEMQQFVSEVPWDKAFASRVEYRDLAFRRKEDFRDYPNALELGFKGGKIRLPGGFSSGHFVQLVLARFAAPYSDMTSFDNLPTPFRCVAVDILKAKQVVFEKGPLQDALRATMSIPAVFAPVQQGDMILVDGGALNNIPVDVVKGMGADVVVAVSLDPPPPKPEDLQDIIGAASRSLSVMIADNERRSLRLADLTVSPDLKGLASTDFLKYEEFIDRGYKAAEARRRMLLTLQVSEDEYAAWKKARTAKRRDEKIRVDFIQVDDQLAPKRREALIQALAPEVGHPVDRELLEAELSKVAGMGRYATAGYTFVKKGATNGLRLFVTEKHHGPPFIKPGFTIDAIPGDGVRLGIGMRVSFLDVGGPASEWRSDFSIGVENRVASEYYYRVKGGKWFVAPRILYEEVTYPYYLESEKIAEFRNRYTVFNTDLGYAFGRFNEFRAGYAIGRRVAKVVTGPVPIDPVDGRLSYFRIRWVHEGQDSALIPRRGVYARTELRWVTDHPGVDRQFAAAEVHTAYAHTLGARNVLIARANGGATASEGLLDVEYALGGAMNLSAYARGQLLGSRYYHGGGYFLRTIQKDTASELGKFFWMASYEMGTAWSAGLSALPRYSGSLGIMGDTAVGVVIFGAAVGDRGEKKIFFRLGKWF